MFETSYKALKLYSERLNAAEETCMKKTAEAQRDFIGARLKTALHEAQQERNGAIEEARAAVKTAISANLAEVRQRVGAAARQPITPGTADAIAMLKAGCLTDTEKRFVLDMYSKNSYLSARMLYDALGEKQPCLSFDGITKDLGETERILNECANSSRPTENYLFQNVVSGNMLSCIAENGQHFIDGDFFNVVE